MRMEDLKDWDEQDRGASVDAVLIIGLGLEPGIWK
jgi:hypothetical protein